MSGDIPYDRVAATRAPTADAWDAFVRDALVPAWLDRYDDVTPWRPQVLEIEVDGLTYLFDGEPSLGDGSAAGDDRTVAVWGRSRKPEGGRDRARLAGLLPDPSRWSGAGRDRGHLVAHAAGGGLDLNLIPQSATLNRGATAAGRLWRRMESYAATHEGTPLFVRAVYDSASWVPAALELGLLTPDGLWWSGFENR